MPSKGTLEEQIKTLENFTPQYNCRFHPTNGWHEVGCSHKEWTKEELQEALDCAKQSIAYHVHLLSLSRQQDRETLKKEIEGMDTAKVSSGNRYMFLEEEKEL